MNEQILRSLYGLKYNPFQPNIPVEDLWHPPGIDRFFFRVENLVMDGGFGMVSGENGLGKSKVLLLLENRLKRIGELDIAEMSRPQSSLADFYRELGDLFGVPLSPSNRYGGFKALRERWTAHVHNTLFRPVLLIDEAQEAAADCLNELRLLGSARFDSERLMTTILCGDSRLPERFRNRNLIPLGTRIRVRKILEPLERDDLLHFLDHALDMAGAPHLVTTELKEVLADHANGNLRVLTSMAADLLETAVRRELSQLDEKLFLEVFSHQPRRRKTAAKKSR